PGNRQRRDASAQPDRRRRDAVPVATLGAGGSGRRYRVRQRRLPRDPRTLPRRVRLEEKRALQGREIDGRYHGLAVACFIEGGGAGPKETARLDLEADGTVSVYVGSAAVGQGLETVMAQIAADTLGLHLGQVRVFHGSTP